MQNEVNRLAYKKNKKENIERKRKKVINLQEAKD